MTSLVGIKGSISLEASLREKGPDSRTFTEVTKLKLDNIGDSVWLELRKGELQGKLEQLGRYLVGWWGDPLVLFQSWISRGSGRFTIGF